MPSPKKTRPIVSWQVSLRALRSAQIINGIFRWQACIPSQQDPGGHVCLPRFVTALGRDRFRPARGSRRGRLSVSTGRAACIVRLPASRAKVTSWRAHCTPGSWHLASGKEALRHCPRHKGQPAFAERGRNLRGLCIQDDDVRAFPRQQLAPVVEAQYPGRP